MLNKEDLDYLLKNFPEDSSEQAVKLKNKLDIIYQQINLQEEFRTRSLELQEKAKELE